MGGYLEAAVAFQALAALVRARCQDAAGDCCVVAEADFPDTAEHSPVAHCFVAEAADYPDFPGQKPRQIQLHPVRLREAI